MQADQDTLRDELRDEVQGASVSAWQLSQDLGHSHQWLSRKLNEGRKVYLTDLYAVRYYLHHRDQ